MKNKLTAEKFKQKFPCFAVPEGWELVDAPDVTKSPDGCYLICHDNGSTGYVCAEKTTTSWDSTYILQPIYEFIKSHYDYQVGDELENGLKVVAATSISKMKTIFTCVHKNEVPTAFYNYGCVFKITRRNGRPVRVKKGLTSRRDRNSIKL